MNKLKKMAAGVLAAATVVTNVGCELKDEPETQIEYYKYDDSNYDEYLVFYVNSYYGAKPLLGKLDTTPISDVLYYKTIDENKVLYEYNKETYTSKSNYEILDSYSIDYFIPEGSDIEKVTTDSEALEIFENFVINEEELKLK